MLKILVLLFAVSCVFGQSVSDDLDLLVSDVSSLEVSDSRCTGIGGRCGDSSNCNGQVVTGRCPGSSSIVCCIPRAGSSSSTTNTGNTSNNRVNRSTRISDVYNDYKSKIGNGLTIDSRLNSQINNAIASLRANNNHKLQLVDRIARAVDLPKELVAGIWFREASLREGVYLHNGDPLGSPTVRVPRGIYFGRDQFVQAAEHALRMKNRIKNALPTLRYGSKDIAAMCAYAEAYNGFGYRMNGRVSAYAMSGTTFYTGGMYVADGVWNGSRKDPRPGVAAIAQAMISRGI